MADTPTPSLADTLRETHAQLVEEKEPKVFELPGYGTQLQVKYRVLSRDERKEIMKQVFSSARLGEDRSSERGMCSTLARACLGFYTERDGELVLLNEAEDLGDDIIRWGDERLAGLFDMKVDGRLRARAVIEYVLAKDDVLELHHNEVSNWMEQALVKADSDF